jgi:hypothetical protein
VSIGAQILWSCLWAWCVAGLLLAGHAARREPPARLLTILLLGGPFVWMIAVYAYMKHTFTHLLARRGRAPPPPPEEPAGYVEGKSRVMVELWLPDNRNELDMLMRGWRWKALARDFLELVRKRIKYHNLPDDIRNELDALQAKMYDLVKQHGLDLEEDE